MSRKTLSIFVLLLIAAGTMYGQSEMSISVRETQVRGSPSFLAKPIGTLSYGSRVAVLQEESGWVKVSFEGLLGWVHSSALTEKKIVLDTVGRDSGSEVSAGEVALAGKGFNEEVEARYKAESELDYTWIDKMEGFGRSPEELVLFLKEGGLEQGEVPK